MKIHYEKGEKKATLKQVETMFATKKKDTTKKEEGWGRGKRKKAVALARVKAGSGKITVNKKPLTQYFHMATQRWKLVKPLMVTECACTVDIDIWVKGGGFTGQCEACIPAIGKALAKFDPDVKTNLRKCNLHSFEILRNMTELNSRLLVDRSTTG